jgi:hypothetical protein
LLKKIFNILPEAAKKPVRHLRNFILYFGVGIVDVPFVGNILVNSKNSE